MTARLRKTRFLRFLRRMAIVVTVVIAVGYPAANFAARLFLQSQLEAALQSEVTIGSVRLFPSHAEIRNIQVQGAQSGVEPLVSIAEVSVGLTIADGLQHGIWADEITVSGPTLRLRFSESGELLTQFPVLPAGGDGPIPLKTLKVVNGAIEIAQPGKKAFVADNAAATLKFGDTIDVVALLPELFGGQWKLGGNLDAASLAGDVRLVVEGLSASSTDLERLPIDMEKMALLDAFQATGALDATCRIPADPKSLLDCVAEVNCWCDSLDVSNREIQVRALHSTVRYAASRLSVVAEGEVLNGHVHVNGSVQIEREPGSAMPFRDADLQWSVRGVELESLARKMGAPVRVAATMNTSGMARALPEGNQITISASTESELSDIEAFGIRPEPVIMKASINGGLEVIDGIPRPSRGDMLFAAHSQGVAANDLVSELLPRLQAMSAEGHKDVDELIQRLQQWESRGRISFAIDVKAPLEAISDPGLVEGSGGIACNELMAGGAVIDNLMATISVQNGTAVLQLNEAQLTDLVSGESVTVECACRVPFSPPGRATADVEITNVSLAGTAMLAGLPSKLMDGSVSTWLKVDAPVGQLADTATWEGQGVVFSPRVAIRGESISDCQVHWTLRNNRIEVRRASGLWKTTSLTAMAAADLAHPFRFAGNLTTSDADLSEISTTVNRIALTSLDASGTARIAGSVTGDAASMNYQCSGELVFQNVSIADRELGTHRMTWLVTPNLIRINEDAGQFFGGDITVTAALIPSAQPINHISGGFRNVRTASLRDALGIQVPVSGTVDGDFELTDLTVPEHLNGRMSLAARNLQVAGVPVEAFGSAVLIQSGLAAASIDARVVGAECKATVQTRISDLLTITPAVLGNPQALPILGEVSVRQLPIERLRRTILSLPGQHRVPPELDGLVDINVQRNLQTIESGAVVTGDIMIRHLVWDRVVWSRQLLTRVDLLPGVLEIREVSGTFADGRVSGRGRVSLAGRPEGNFRLTVSRMNLAKVAAPWRARSGNVIGMADVHVEGRLGRRISGRASVAIDRAKVSELTVTHVRLPLDWSVSPSTREIHVSTSAAAMDIGGGRIRGQADARWNGRLDLNLTGQAQHIDTRKLTGQGGAMGGGVLDGNVQLRARSARTLNDLSGQFHASLKDAQALQLPILDQTSRFLGSLSRSTSFEDGTIKGRLGNGIVTLERMTLMASNVRMVIEGSATLAGRLNLFVSAYTSETGPADKLLRFANSPIMLAAPAPVALIAKVNNALKDRTIHVHVGGTVRQPLVRLQPGRQLRQEALQFLVQSALNYSPDTINTTTR